MEKTTPQSGILKTVEKNKKPRREKNSSGANSFICPNLAITPLL
jgi:hypothetical protein